MMMMICTTECLHQIDFVLFFCLINESIFRLQKTFNSLKSIYKYRTDRLKGDNEKHNEWLGEFIENKKLDLRMNK